jgi:hypothetical protein
MSRVLIAMNLVFRNGLLAIAYRGLRFSRAK